MKDQYIVLILNMMMISYMMIHLRNHICHLIFLMLILLNYFLLFLSMFHINFLCHFLFFLEVILLFLIFYMLLLKGILYKKIKLVLIFHPMFFFELKDSYILYIYHIFLLFLIIFYLFLNP